MDIVIVEDHDAARARLVTLLDGQSGFKVTAAVDSSEKAIEFMASSVPDVIIHDLGLPGLSGAAAIKAAKGMCPSAEILVFTVIDEDEQVFAALKAGASGYILKDSLPVQIISALDEIKAGGSPMSFSIARKVLKEFQGLKADEDLKKACSPLSQRETEILELMHKGDSYKEIADKLCISIRTVHTHIKNIYEKLHVNSRAQATYEAMSRKFIGG